jgi:hypothetical protein
MGCSVDCLSTTTCCGAFRRRIGILNYSAPLCEGLKRATVFLGINPLHKTLTSISTEWKDSMKTAIFTNLSTI